MAQGHAKEINITNIIDTWLTGSGAPSATTYLDGTMYFDYLNNDIYQLQTGSWTLLTNLGTMTSWEVGDGSGTPQFSVINNDQVNFAEGNSLIDIVFADPYITFTPNSDLSAYDNSLSNFITNSYYTFDNPITNTGGIIDFNYDTTPGFYLNGAQFSQYAAASAQSGYLTDNDWRDFDAKITSWNVADGSNNIQFDVGDGSNVAFQGTNMVTINFSDPYVEIDVPSDLSLYDNTISMFIPEAPNDGELYGRKDLMWEIIPAGSTNWNVADGTDTIQFNVADSDNVDFAATGMVTINFADPVINFDVPSDLSQYDNTISNFIKPNYYTFDAPLSESMGTVDFLFNTTAGFYLNANYFDQYQADAATDGFLSHTDWTTFNGKMTGFNIADATLGFQFPIIDQDSLTFSGSGMVTLSYNVPTIGFDVPADLSQYDNSTSQFINDAPSDGTFYGRLNGAWADLTTGGDPLSISGAVISFGYDTVPGFYINTGLFSQYQANIGQSGYLDGGDWSTFSGKMDDLEIFIDAADQGGYRIINFYTGPGSSSGNSLYLGNGGIELITNDLLAQTAAVSSLATTTAPNDASNHTYRVSAYLTVNAILTDVIQVQVTYTDENSNTQTQTFATVGVTPAISLSATGNFIFSDFIFRVKFNTAVTIKTVLTNALGTINYDVGAIIQRMN